MGVKMDDVQETSSPIIQALGSEARNETAESMAKQYGGGTENARGLLNQGGNSFNSGLSYGDKAMSSAIRGKYMGDFNRNAHKVNLNNLRNADEDHIRKLSVASELANQEVEMNRQKEILKHKMKQAKKQQRGALIGSVLGIVGGVAGGVAGSMAAPGVGTGAGAMAGSALGSGLGQAIGGS